MVETYWEHYIDWDIVCQHLFIVGERRSLHFLSKRKVIGTLQDNGSGDSTIRFLYWLLLWDITTYYRVLRPLIFIHIYSISFSTNMAPYLALNGYVYYSESVRLKRWTKNQNGRWQPTMLPLGRADSFNRERGPSLSQIWHTLPW